MLTKYLFFLPLVVIASAALLSSIHEPFEKHKGFKMDLSIFNGDHDADGSSYQNSDLVKRGDGSGALSLFQIDEIYATELYMGSKGERLKVAVALNNVVTWVMDRRVICRHNTKREVRSKRDIQEHEPKDSSSSITSGAEKAKISEKKTSSHQDISKRDRSNCQFWGTFNSAKSKTFKVSQSNPSFSFKYIDDSFVEGVWASDLVGTSKTMVNLTFGVAKEASRVFGSLGVGLLDQTERYLRNGRQHAYFPMSLKNAGYIKRLMYSLSLGGQDSRSGSILFGAVDHRKYDGQLQTVPMVSILKSMKKVELAVVLDKVYLENSDQKVVLLNEPIGATFESAISHQQVPMNVLLALAESMSGVNWSGSNTFKVDCGYRTSTGNIVYEFSGIRIKVPVRDLVLKFKDICYLGVYAHEPNNGKPMFRLGNVFLRKAYFIVDLERKEVSMAQAKSSYGEDVVEVVDSIPGAVKAERYSSTSIVDSVSKPTVAKFNIEADEW